MTWEDLVSDVFACTHCEGTGLPFARASDQKFYRFPPVIGATGKAPLLFVGINPRISESNRDLHEYLVHNPDAFRDLSENRVKDVPYIPNLEGHYRVHAQVAAALFPSARFGEIAAVTELHFCASASTSGLLDSRRCTDRYLARVLQLISPTVVFAIGKHVDDRLSARVGWPGGRPPVFRLPHPNDRLTATARAAQIAAAIDAARPHINGPGESPHETAPQPTPKSDNMFAAQYSHSRLCFKADVIEPLRMDDRFRITSKAGTFAMTKREFYDNFPNVVASVSYTRDQIYHYKQPPEKALRFKIRH